MSALVLGLLMFLGAHSIRIVADAWRKQQIARLGEKRWKAIVSLVSAIGLILLVWGYSQTRAMPVELWMPPTWARHLASLLTVLAFVLLTAVYVRGNHIKAAVGHPMVAGVMLWAFAHLLANARLNDVLLFSAFFLWATFDFVVSRRRDRAAGARYPQGTLPRDALVVVVGLIAWVLFVFAGHKWLIGVAPFG